MRLSLQALSTCIDLCLGGSRRDYLLGGPHTLTTAPVVYCLSRLHRAGARQILRSWRAHTRSQKLGPRAKQWLHESLDLLMGLG